MTEYEAKHFSAVTMLMQALRTERDSLAIQRARNLLDEAYALKKEHPDSCSTPFPPPRNAAREELNFARALTKLMGLRPDQTKEALEIHDGLRPAPQAGKDPHLLLSYLVSGALRDSHLVLWWSGQVFKTAILCPNMKAAFYARALLGAIRICPHCTETFFPQRADQNYCSVPHREAHRVARWRANNKANQTTSKRQARRLDGARKTR